MQRHTQQLIDRAISDDNSLKEYIEKVYSDNCRVEDFVFYKNYLVHFIPPSFKILFNEEEKFDNLLFIKFVAASFKTEYSFINSDDSDSLRMNLFLRNEDEIINRVIDELDFFQLENMVLNYIEEQITMEEAASKCQYKSLILSLQRNYKLKKWNMFTAMAQSKRIANQLINREN